MNVPRILIVDDLPEMLMITSKSLLTSGEKYEIREALNGKQAYETMGQWTPDLVITDWDMPAMSGLELISKMKQDETFCDIPVIMITGMMVTPEDLKEAFRCGASDFLRKPFDKTELLARTKAMLIVSKSIKDKKNYNLVLSDYNRFINSLLLAIPSPMVYYNKDGIVLGCNESFQKTFSHISSNFIGTEVYTICPNPEQMKAQSEDMINKGLQQTSFETVMKTVNKEDATFLVTKTIFYSPDKKPEGLICLLSDISEIKQEHARNLEEKKKELVSTAMRLMQYSTMNNKLLEDLEILDKHTDEEGKKLIAEFKSKYNIKVYNSMWEEFETRFGQVYEDFYHRLVKLHPELTPNEKKLCALLKLNLSSKDIAALTLQDAKSVDMARYRLRKKLGLQQEDSLVEYLQSI
ncbi:MAG TPA: response regulator [Bacteroidales bacterium]|nr:response regulator [Bacteroidales bacterium]